MLAPDARECQERFLRKGQRLQVLASIALKGTPYQLSLAKLNKHVTLNVHTDSAPSKLLDSG